MCFISISFSSLSFYFFSLGLMLPVHSLRLLIGPKGASLRSMCQRTGAVISLKGRGSTKSSASSDEDLHVLIEGTQECVTRAEHEVDEILYNPERAARIKSEQLQNLAKQRSSDVATNSSSSSSSAYSPPSSSSAPWSSSETYGSYGHPPGGGGQGGGRRARRRKASGRSRRRRGRRSRPARQCGTPSPFSPKRK